MRSDDELIGERQRTDRVAHTIRRYRRLGAGEIALIHKPAARRISNSDDLATKDVDSIVPAGLLTAMSYESSAARRRCCFHPDAVAQSNGPVAETAHRRPACKERQPRRSRRAPASEL
jgi:hypothetical protein